MSLFESRSGASDLFRPFLWLALFAFLIGIVNIFLLPSEIGSMYARDGQQSPVTGVTGCWIFLPLVGWFIWLVKVQSRMNEFWASHTAVA